MIDFDEFQDEDPLPKPLTPRQLEILDLEDQVLSLALKGTSHKDIANQLGISEPTSKRRLEAALARPGNQTLAKSTMIVLEANKLDALQVAIWSRAMHGDKDSIKTVLDIMQRRAKMFGLDFADQVNAKAVEIEEAKVRLMATALAQALQSSGVSTDIQKNIAASFFSELRQITKKD